MANIYSEMGRFLQEAVSIDDTFKKPINTTLKEAYDSPQDDPYELYYNALGTLEELKDEYNNIKRRDIDSLVDFIYHNMGANNIKKIFGTDVHTRLYSIKEDALRDGIESWFKKDFLSDMFERPLLSKILKIHQAEVNESLNEDLRHSYTESDLDKLGIPVGAYLEDPEKYNELFGTNYNTAKYYDLADFQQEHWYNQLMKKLRNRPHDEIRYESHRGHDIVIVYYTIKHRNVQEDFSDARPAATKIFNFIEMGADPAAILDELLRFLPDSALVDFADYYGENFLGIGDDWE